MYTRTRLISSLHALETCFFCFIFIYEPFQSNKCSWRNFLYHVACLPCHSYICMHLYVFLCVNLYLKQTRTFIWYYHTTCPLYLTLSLETLLTTGKFSNKLVWKLISSFTSFWWWGPPNDQSNLMTLTASRELALN